MMCCVVRSLLWFTVALSHKVRMREGLMGCTPLTMAQHIATFTGDPKTIYFHWIKLVLSHIQRTGNIRFL
ncbi:TPA: hypothetical protein JBJ29_12165 [Legionella pneumophila]|nr:hypothetical protein [Legionella pneumophila]HAU1639089.1 hypothetical protein [Legionella pneumophila]